MIRASLTCLGLVLLTAGCGNDGMPRLPEGYSVEAGPVLAPDIGRPCDIYPSDEDAVVSWAQAPTRSEGESPNEYATVSKFPGIQIRVADRVQELDQIPVEIVDPSTCRVVAQHVARYVEDVHGRGAYHVPLEEVRADIGPGSYIARVDSSVLEIGGIGSVLQIRPNFFLQDPKCEGQLAFDTEIDFGSVGGERVFPIIMDAAADLCVEVSSTSDFWVVREIVINQQRVWPASADQDDLNRYVVEYPGRAHEYSLKVALAKGSARVVARVTRKDTPSGQPGITCGGNLQGYNDPFVETPRRAIERAGVEVGCTAVYRSQRKFDVKTIFGSVRQGEVIKRAQQRMTSNSSGIFAGSISEDAIVRAGAGSDDEFLGVMSDCIHDSQCGVDRYGSQTNNVDWALWLPIVNVPDIAFSGLVARLISKDTIRGQPAFSTGMARASVFAPFDLFGPEPANDLPVVFHEQFDPLLEDGTEGIVWSLGGQPTDYSKPNDPGEIRASASAGTIVGTCYPKHNQLFPGPQLDPDCKWTEECQSSASTQTERFRCEGTNVLKLLLEKGFDVWLVDHVRPDPTVLELAARVPVLYQKIADFPSAEWFGRTNRKMTVVGISMGGVVARTGIRLWELQDDLDRLGAASELQIHRPDLLRDSASDRIAMYASFEAPHRGTRLPITFQALIKDNTMPSRLNFAELMNSRAAQQLTVPYVKAGVDTPCIQGGEPKDCTLRPGDIAPVFVSEVESTLMSWQAMDVLDALDSQPRERIIDDGPLLSHDGLPTTVPNIAVSNGVLNTGSSNSSGRFAKIELDTSLIGIDAFWPDETINLHNSMDPQGSGLTQIYRLEELEESGRRHVIGSYSLRTFVYKVPIFVPTSSALNLDNVWPATAAIELPLRWHDVMYQPETRAHSNFDEQQCRFLIYHLDGKMRGDRDGYPACRSGHSSCATGAKRPGYIIAPGGVLTSGLDDYCDPDDDDERVLPPAIPAGTVLVPDKPVM